jgi:hypothetical protein
MKRLFACCFAWLVLAFGSAQGVPARPRYEPPDPPKPSPPMTNLRGTTWHGHFFSTDCQVTFEHNGALTYRRNQETDPGFWKLSDNNVVIEINMYSEHRGTVTGNIMEGQSTNKSGMRGQFRLQLGNPGK